MFRVGVLVCRYPMRCTTVPVHRSFCQAKEKCYIIRTGEGKKTILYESQIMDKFRKKQLEGACREVVPIVDPWKKLSEMMILAYVRSKQQASSAMTKFKVQEKVLMVKKAACESVGRKKKALENKLQAIDWSQQWQTAKSSAPVQFVVNLPERITLMTSSSIQVAQRYYVMFMQSEFKARMQPLIILAWTKGKRVAIQIYKFIYEAYFEKPTKAIKK